MTIKLDNVPVLERLLLEETAVLYKHSTRCPTSVAAKRHMIRVIKTRPDLPFYIVDVLADRSISQEAARRLGIRHESPQVLVLKNGEVVWHASHYAVRKAAIETALAR